MPTAHTFRLPRLLAAGAALMFGTAVAAVACWWDDYHVRRLSVVEEGVLYRSAQPEGDDWTILRDKYGIRTVISLRADKPDKPWAVAERNSLQEHGMRYILMPIGPERITNDQLRQLVEITSDPQYQPVLVHCELGKSRTGVVVAAYRIVVQGWSYAAAIADAQRYKEHMEPGYDAYLKRLARGGGWRPPERPAGLHSGEAVSW